MRASPILLSLSLVLSCTNEPSGSGEESSTTDEPSPSSTDTGVGADDSTSTGDPESSSFVGESSTTAVAPGPQEIEVSIAGEVVASGGTHGVPPVDVGALGEALEVEVRNVGGSALAIASATLTSGDLGAFVLDDTALGETLAPGQASSFTVAFNPIDGGRKIARLVIESDDEDEGSFEVELQARSTPNTWRMLGPSSSPPPRGNMGMVGTGDGRAVLFGGEAGIPPFFDDTWVFDAASGAWTELSPASVPTGRSSPALAYLGEGRVLLFGGFDEMAVRRDDTWLLDLGTGEWTELSPPQAPPGRNHHAMVGIGDGQAIVFGGEVSLGVPRDDTWRFDLDTETWTALDPDARPTARSHHAMAFDGIDTIVMMGGRDDLNEPAEFLWNFNRSSETWDLMTRDEQLLRTDHGMVGLDDGLVVSFSGKPTCCSAPVFGTWGVEAGDSNASLLEAHDEAPPRQSYGMAHLQRDVLLVFGGRLASGGPSNAETWEYVGP